MKFKPLHAIAIALLLLGGAIAASPPAVADVAGFFAFDNFSNTAIALATTDEILGHTNLEAIDVVNVIEVDPYDTRAVGESAKRAGAPPNAIAHHTDLELRGQPPTRAVPG